jgi:uncharacterized membrane protein
MPGTTELWLMLASATLLIGYHLWFLHELQTRPHRTTIGSARALRAAWVADVMTNRRDILAVQTMRNWVMTTSFLASTAALISVGLLTFLMSSDGVTNLIHRLNFAGTRSEDLLTLKLALIIVDFFVAFFNLSLAMRHYNYAVFLIGLSLADEPDVAIARATRHVQNGAMRYAAGMRGFYLTVPLVMWLFGPEWLLAGAAIVTLALWRHDHTG